jgi:hypothetical protein
MKPIVFAALLTAGVLGYPCTLTAQQDALYQRRVAARIAELVFDEKTALWFTNADTGLPVASALVDIENFISVTTDADGVAVFPIPPDGSYRFRVAKNGFMALEDSFTVVFGSLFFYKYSIPPAAPLGHIKIVLDWEKDPADLDSHLIKERHYHISFHDMKKAQDGTAQLDRDDTNGYGPETITITALDNSAVYRFYVHDYTNRHQNNSARLAASRAAVRVYNNNRLVKTFTVDTGRRGVIWEVFAIVNGQIQEVSAYR